MIARQIEVNLEDKKAKRITDPDATWSATLKLMQMNREDLRALVIFLRSRHEPSASRIEAVVKTMMGEEP